MQYTYGNSPDRNSAGTEPAESPAVVCIGYTPATLRERSEALRDAGYTVQTENNREEALDRLGQRSYSALVIGEAVPEQERLEFVDAARRVNPQTVVVLMYRDSIRRAEAANAVLSAKNGAPALVHALRELLGQ